MKQNFYKSDYTDKGYISVLETAQNYHAQITLYKNFVEVDTTAVETNCIDGDETKRFFWADFIYSQIHEAGQKEITKYL